MKVKLKGIILEEANGYCWAFGPYGVMKKVARSLRADDSLRTTFAEYGVRVGRRQGDVPPRGSNPQGGFAKKVDRNAPELSIADAKARSGSLRTGSSKEFEPRLTDQFEEASKWYRSKTLEAHHLVESSIIKKLGIREAKLQPDQMPCVLVSAELHRRWFTAGVGSSRHDFTPEMEVNEVVEQLRKVYARLYEGSALSILRRRADKIIDKIERSLPQRGRSGATSSSTRSEST